MLSPEQVAHITAQVCAQCPEIGAAPPVIRPEPATGEPARFLLIYRHTALTADGRPLARVVRVVVNLHGQIVRLSTSR